MIDEAINNLLTFFKTYELEIMWASIAIFVGKRLIEKLNGSSNKSHIITNVGEKFTIKHRQRKIKSTDLILAVFVSVMLLYFIYKSILSSQEKEALYGLGLVITLIISTLFIYHTTQIEIGVNLIVVNGKRLKPENIHSIELWDDLITVNKLSGKKKEIELSSTEKSFDTVSAMMNSLKKFCQFHSIPLEDNFEHEITKNENLQ